MTLNIKTVAPDEAEVYLRKSDAERSRSINLPFGGTITGSAELVCRDINTGKVAWGYAAKNVVTDFGRRYWLNNGLIYAAIVCSPSTEAPDFRRNSLLGPYDGNQNPISTSTNGTYSGGIRTWGVYTFSAPSSATRQIGTVGLTVAGTMDFQIGLRSLISYLLLSPVKTQTTSQQLEVIYKLAFQFNVNPP